MILKFLADLLAGVITGLFSTDAITEKVTNEKGKIDIPASPTDNLELRLNRVFDDRSKG